MIYHSLVSSQLRYGILAWGSANSTALNKVDAIHDRIIKYLRLNGEDLVSSYNRLGILTIKNLYKFELSKFIQTCRMGMNPKAFDDYLTPVSHFYATRSSNNNGLYKVFKPRTEKGKSVINFVGVTIWNNLPSVITNFNFITIKAFKTKLKEHLLSEQ